MGEQGRISATDDKAVGGAAERGATLFPCSHGGDVARLQAEIAALKHENGLLQEKLNAALDGTGICLWQGTIPTGELRVFNLQNFQVGDMVPHFEQWSAKLHPDDRAHAIGSYVAHLEGKPPSTRPNTAPLARLARSPGCGIGAASSIGIVMASRCG